MKQTFLIFIIFINLLVLYAQPVNVGVFTNIPVRKDFNNQNVAAELLAEGSFFDFEADAGFKACKTGVHCTVTGLYMPEIFESFRIGGGLRYHFMNYEKIFTENNLLATAHVRYTTPRLFTIEGAYNAIFIFTNINSIKNDTSILFNFTSGFELFLSKQFADIYNAYLNITTFDYFDYPNLGTPFIKIGLEVTPIERISAMVDFTIKMEDMFTSTTYISGSYVRLGMKVKVW